MRRITIVAALFTVVLAATASTASSTGVSPSQLLQGGSREFSTPPPRR